MCWILEKLLPKKVKMMNMERKQQYVDRVLYVGNKYGWPQTAYSWTGYLPNSPDRFRSYNVIPSQWLTMKTVPHDILAIADTGQVQIMKANSPHNYHFPNALWVHETPLINISH
jgi:hypothetical protein